MDIPTQNDVTMGDWPQRLLHVPTMTSLEWREGHRYGSHIKPRYSAISYTWGRYQLKSPDEQPHTTAIEVKGVGWEIPRIDESHFTVAQLEKLIRRSVDYQLTLEDGTILSSSFRVEFVWLDIACINQTPNHPQMAAEIGRQAQIFRKAKRVLVWLNQATEKGLESQIRNITIAAEIAEQRHINTFTSRDQWTTIPDSVPKSYLRKSERWLASIRDYVRTKVEHGWFNSPASVHDLPLLQGNEPWLISAVRNITLLLGDPWFSSLWTLQEAFLSQWARVISGEVEPLSFDSLQLKQIFTACETLITKCKSSVACKKKLNIPSTEAESELINLVEKSGLAALAAENPMSLYTVATNRTTSRPTDRIYGIMQVFGFKLGISAPNANAKVAPDLPELELQLGRRILIDYPILSQLHVHTKSVEPGQAWRVSRSSRVPELVSSVGFYVTSSFMGKHTALCQLDCEEVDDILWATCSGNACALELVAKAWLSVDHFTRRAGSGAGKSIQQIILDSSELLPFSAFINDPRQDLERDERQHNLTAEILNICHRENSLVTVLLLGRFTDEEHGEAWWNLTGGRVPDMTGDRYNIGLILIRKRDERRGMWRRLGICIWDLACLVSGKDVAPERDFLEGHTKEWRFMKGRFG